MVAIGDWFEYYDNSPRDRQREVFVEQSTGPELDLPIVIHSQDAQQDTLEILRRYAGRGGIDALLFRRMRRPRCVWIWVLSSLGGSITFKNARRLAEIVKLFPRRMLLETIVLT